MGGLDGWKRTKVGGLLNQNPSEKYDANVKLNGSFPQASGWKIVQIVSGSCRRSFCGGVSLQGLPQKVARAVIPKLSEPRPKKTQHSPHLHMLLTCQETRQARSLGFASKCLAYALCIIERRWRPDVVRSPNINFHESRRSLLDAFESAGKPITIVPSLGWSSRGLSKSQIRPTSISDRTSVTSLKSFPPGSLLAQSWKIKNIASYPLEKSNWFWRFTDIRIPLDPWDKGIFTCLCTLKKSTIDGSVYRNRPIYPSWGYQLHIEIPSW